MTRRVCLLAVLAVAATQASTAPAQPPAPGVRVIGLQPLAVQGLRFRPGERVTLVLFLRGRHTTLVRASRHGSFVVRFAEYADLCTAFTLRALGAHGVRAATMHRPPPSCAALDPIP